MPKESSPGANPYSTGGGGTVLEHRYGALLLARLLVGDPVEALGDEVSPESVRFQASSFSKVDDLVVVGRTADGSDRRLSIGVRRSPALTASDDSSAKLLVSYLQVVTEDWDQVLEGRWRLALAVVSWNPAARQLAALAEIAHVQPDAASFRAEVARTRRTNKDVRAQLKALDTLVEKAAASPNVSHEVVASELTWRVLHRLWVLELRLEGVGDSDRSAAVTRLRDVVPDSSLLAADALFKTLEELSDRYASAGAQVTESMLRRDLQGTVIERNRSYSAAWRTLDSFSETAEAQVQFS